MKTNYNAEYLENKYGVSGSKTFIAERKKELEEQTNVSWSAFVSHGKYKLNPIVNFKKDQVCLLFSEIQEGIEICKEFGDRKFGISFLKIVEHSDFSFEKIEALIYHLVKKLHCSVITDRGGNCVGVVLRNDL